MKKIITFFIICISMFTVIYAHSGKTDNNGGHYDDSTGEYHYHHGHSAHQHQNGICPYETSSNNEEVEEVSTDTELKISSDDNISEIDNLKAEIEKLKEQIAAKQSSIGKQSSEILEKNNEIEQLKNDKETLHFIYWLVIICMTITIWCLVKEHK